jgi:hypothetical protein
VKTATAARVATLAMVLVFVLLAGGWRLARIARAELDASDAAWRKGDAAAATVHARSAARAYVPGGEHMDRAYTRLREVATTSERQGDTTAALFAWRAVLAAKASSRPFSSCGETCEAAQIAIDRLAAAVTSARAPSLPGRRSQAVETPPMDVVPHARWGAVLVLAAGLMIAAGHRLARVLAPGGALVRGEARSAAVLGGAGLAAWVLSILCA